MLKVIKNVVKENGLFVLKMWVSENTYNDLPNEVFLYEKVPPYAAESGYPVETFTGVASRHMLYNTGLVPSFKGDLFRKSFVYLTFESDNQARDFIKETETLLATLVGPFEVTPTWDPTPIVTGIVLDGVDDIVVSTVRKSHIDEITYSIPSLTDSNIFICEDIEGVTHFTRVATLEDMAGAVSTVNTGSGEYRTDAITFHHQMEDLTYLDAEGVEASELYKEYIETNLKADLEDIWGNSDEFSENADVEVTL